MRHLPLAALALLALVPVAGCGTSATTPSTSTTNDGLWAVSGSDGVLLRLGLAQLSASGSPTPATAITTPSAALFVSPGIAFDADGSLWTTSQSDARVIAFAPGSLGVSGSVAAAVTIGATGGSLDGPAGIAFDRAHCLWVANFGNGTLVQFTPAQLRAGGSPTPNIVLSGLGHPNALAFDATGALWVSDGQAQTIVKYEAAHLAASGSPAPDVVIGRVGTSLVGFGGLAFDEAGTLWVASPGSRKVGAFARTQLAESGAPTPQVVLASRDGSLPLPVGLAFDGAGNLWVINGDGALERFERGSLVPGASPTPAARLVLTGHTLFMALAFWPVPAGLPLN